MSITNWFLSWNSILLRLSHVNTCSNGSFILNAKQNSIIWLLTSILTDIEAVYFPTSCLPASLKEWCSKTYYRIILINTEGIHAWIVQTEHKKTKECLEIDPCINEKKLQKILGNMMDCSMILRPCKKKI